MDDATALILDLLARGHAVQFRARGDSMHPVIRDNDLLHVEPARHFVRGDVVLVLAERGLTAHRVVSRRGTTIVTRGDNAPGADDPCEAVRVLGKVTSVDRDGVQLPVSRSAVGVATALLRRLRRRVRRAG
jgi:phage repressor protein C with HTH and peptisase S24 domain